MKRLSLRKDFSTMPIAGQLQTTPVQRLTMQTGM